MVAFGSCLLVLCCFSNLESCVGVFNYNSVAIDMNNHWR